MQKTIDYFFKLLEFLVVACMVAMVIMVFGNVVLRYGFNSGITISDEMSVNRLIRPATTTLRVSARG